MDELKQFVDREVPAPTPQQIDDEINEDRKLPATQLRALLGRRLLRSDRLEEASAYFDHDELKEAAKEYVDARRRAGSWWRGPIGRAKAWFDAAMIARFDGLELLGFELAPDYGIVEGSLDLTESEDESDGAEGQPEFTSASELDRLQTSEAQPDVRFHYRRTAVDLASRAADELPRSSQAFAAVLCHATAWMIDREPDQADALYRRYLREGPYVPWGKGFGRRCSPPDFSGAWMRPWRDHLASIRRFGEAETVILDDRHVDHRPQPAVRGPTPAEASS